MGKDLKYVIGRQEANKFNSAMFEAGKDLMPAEAFDAVNWNTFDEWVLTSSCWIPRSWPFAFTRAHLTTAIRSLSAPGSHPGLGAERAPDHWIEPRTLTI